MTDASSLAVALIAHCEGCRLLPYQDVAGYWSIGFGNRFLLDGTPVDAITAALSLLEASQLFDTTLSETLIPAVDLLITAPVPSCQRGALYSFAWNEGAPALGGSTLLRYVNLGATAQAADQFSRWVYAAGRPIAGLATRRALERAVFLGDVTSLPMQTLPTAPHPVFTSTAVSLSDADMLNAQELARLQA